MKVPAAAMLQTTDARAVSPEALALAGRGRRAGLRARGELNEQTYANPIHKPQINPTISNTIS